MQTTIMIIDDDIAIHKTLEVLIRNNNLGTVVSALDTGEDAVDEILFYRPNLVLIDLLLPKMDGITIMEQARQRGYAGKFIMISQVEDDSMVGRAYECGVEFYIGKPINAIEAVTVIRNVTSQIRLEQSLAQIQSAVSILDPHFISAHSEPQPSPNEKITAIFSDIGILGAVGSEELRRLLLKLCARGSTNFDLSALYDELLEEDNKSGVAPRKALEQRVRRTIQKALSTLAELGCDDYSNSIFNDYSTLLFEFSQVRQEMRHIRDPRAEPGKINTKKFFAGMLARL